MLTTSELTNLIHMRTRRMMPMVTDVVPRNNTVLYTVGSRRYLANRSLEVLEVADDKVFSSNHALYQQGLLRGGVRDEDGNLVVKDVFEYFYNAIRGDSGSTIIKDEQCR